MNKAKILSTIRANERPHEGILSYLIQAGTLQVSKPIPNEYQNPAEASFKTNTNTKTQQKLFQNQYQNPAEAVST